MDAEDANPMQGTSDMRRNKATANKERSGEQQKAARNSCESGLKMRASSIGDQNANRFQEAS